MTARAEDYAVPVYRFEEGAPVDAQLADDAASEYVRVQYTDRHGDPSLRAIHSRGDATDRYRFRITDDTLGWCSYRGDEAALPVAVQHAVHAFGYGITDLPSLTARFFDALEAFAIVERLSTLEDTYEELPVTKRAIHDASTGLNDLSLALLARAVLSDDEYWTMWDTFLEDDAQADVATNVELSAHLWETVMDTEIGESLHDASEGRLIPVSSILADRSAAHEDYVFVDLVTAFGIHRFQFHQTGDGECVHQDQGESRVPERVVAALNDTGRTVTNATSVAQAETPVDVAELATQFCKELPDGALTPAAADRFELNVVNNAYLCTSMAAVHLKLHDMNRAVVETVQGELCDQLGITDSSQIPGDVIGAVFNKLVMSVPTDLRDELVEYIDEHPAHVPPETDDGRGDSAPLYHLNR